ncbi:hypothetical protein PA01_01720 [Azoarcus sp. PA01]|nr:hypothetical protein PA01_01720 [Azoarcus sp. PA01]
MKSTSAYLIIGLFATGASLIPVGEAVAQSGHFLEKATNCTDIGTQLACTVKVAGLGGTTFEIEIEGQGVATVECTNPGGNIAPGQTFEFNALGSSGPLETPRNGQSRLTVMTAHPAAPADSCPNSQWTAEVVDVEFTTATLTLKEDNVVVDTQTVDVE